MKVIPIIPSLNPDNKLILYIEELIKIGFKKIIIVNDGSSKRYDKYFEELKSHKECIVLTHIKNQGKGRALKTAFNYYLENYSNYFGVVTADADGQHSPKDTLNTAKELIKNKTSLILGVRNFNLKNVPLRSKVGNKITKIVFSIFNGKIISDTQTGLRGIPNDLIKEYLNLDGERFEYEMNMLIHSIINKKTIVEVPIETIYIRKNRSSHFSILLDSIKIYKMIIREFFRFSYTSFMAFLVDILLFFISIKLIFSGLNISLAIILSTILARVASSYVNYILTKKVVFNCSKKHKELLVKYYGLTVVQTFTSALLVIIVTNIFIDETISKIVVDSLLFIISYNIQKKWIFKK